MKVELNTLTCPIIIPDTYGTEFQYKIADECWDDFKEMFCEVGGGYIKRAIKETKDFKSCPVWVSKKLISPREYNYVTDSIDFTIDVSDEIIDTLKTKRVSDQFLKYVKKFGSYPGFASNYPITKDEIEEAFVKPGITKFELLIAEFLMYEVEYRIDLEDYQRDFIDDVTEKVYENGYDITDDEEVDESKSIVKESETKKYTVTVGFAGFRGVDNDYTEFASNQDDAEEQALEEAADDLEVEEVEYNEETGEYDVQISFAGMKDGCELYSVDASDEDDAKECALGFAKDDLEVLSVSCNESKGVNTMEKKNKEIKKVVNDVLDGKTLTESMRLCESTVDDDKVAALLQFLDLSDTEANRERVTVAAYNDNVYCIDGDNDFLICTDDEADKEYEDSIENLIDDLGIQAFTPSAQEYILENCCDHDNIIDFYQDDVRSYAEDILSEEENNPKTIEVKDENGDMVEVEVTNRLFQECMENDILDLDDFTAEDFEDGDYVGDKDLVELYCDKFQTPEDQGYDSPYEWLKFNFGDQWASDFVKDHCALDIEEIAEYIKGEDGRGNELNGWDGTEYEEDVNGTTYYIYPNCDFKRLNLEDLQDDSDEE